MERIQQYDFEIIHRKGKLHGNADGLSRRPCEEGGCRYCSKLDSREEELVGRIILGGGSWENWREDQLEDPTIGKFLRGKEEDRRPLWQEIVSEGAPNKLYWSQWDSLVLRDGVLHRRWESPNLKTCIFQTIVSQKRATDLEGGSRLSFWRALWGK